MNPMMNLARDLYFDISVNQEQAGNAYIFTNPIGKVGPGIPFPLHQLVKFEEALIKHGITVVSDDGITVSTISPKNYINYYLSGHRLIEKLQSSIVPGKWASYAFRPKSNGYIEVDFGVVLPTTLKDCAFVIDCMGNEPVEIFRHYDKHFGALHWFMPTECVIGIRCRFKLELLPSYLEFNFSFSDSSLAQYSAAYRKIVNFTNLKMLEGLPDLPRIQRVASKNANEFSFLNDGRTSYLRLKSIAENEGLDINANGFSVLDWGVGCGRVARHFLEHTNISLTGIDIDDDNLNWCRKNLVGEYIHVHTEPPTLIPNDCFDLIYSCSVLSHLTEDDADRWLCEMSRILSNKGVALLSYNGLSNSSVYLSRRPEEFSRVLNRQLFDSDINHELDGFISKSDYYRASFASDDWWMILFNRYFDVLRIEYSVVSGWQHIAILRKKLGLLAN